jgi:hypothetical protein
LNNSDYNVCPTDEGFMGLCGGFPMPTEFFISFFTAPLFSKTSFFRVPVKCKTKRNETKPNETKIQNQNELKILSLRVHGVSDHFRYLDYHY